MFRSTLLVSLLIAATALFGRAAAAPGPDPEILAVVGRLVSIKRLPSPCERKDGSAEPDCIMLDGLYEAKYEIQSVLSGPAHGLEISFRIADHYGFPRFAHYRNALLFVTIHADRNVLQKYQGYAVHRTTNGSWASCGDPYNEFFGDPAQGVQAIDFADDLGIVGDFSEEGIRERFPEAKYLDLSNGRIRCRRGIPLSDLYERVRSGVLAARGITIPALDR